MGAKFRNTRQRSQDVVDKTRDLLKKPVTEQEQQGFGQAYNDLASQKRSTIDGIYRIDDNSFIPGLIKQALYGMTVKDYSKKLYNNFAHFSPWSTRAYIVGHQEALKTAQLAYFCKQLADSKISEKDTKLPQELREAIDKIKQNPKKIWP